MIISWRTEVDDSQSVQSSATFSLRQVLLFLLWLSALFAIAVQFQGGLTLLFLGISLMIYGIMRRKGLPLLAGIPLTLLGMFLPSVEYAREAARRSACEGHLAQLGLALQTYHDVYGSFPPAYIADAQGRPMHSWRVLLLPFIEESALYNAYRFDEPWNGPNNSKLATKIWDVYRCPSDSGPKTDTNYVAVVGPNTVWPGSTSTKMSDIQDGISYTIMLVEVKNSGIHWMEPRDLMIDQVTSPNARGALGISSHHPGGAHVLFVDASRAFIEDHISPGFLPKAIDINGGEMRTSGGY